LNLDAVRRKNADTEHLKDWIHLLFEQALLAEGSPIEDPTGFAARLTALLEDASGRAAANG
jgi:molecular chaperone HtpG